MSKELVVSSNRHETKVAVLEDDQLVEIYFQHANEYSLAGSIHKGRVTRVLPGMQSAFVDLGLDRDTFLYVSDFFEENGDEYDRIPDERSSLPGSRAEAPRAQVVAMPTPAALVREINPASEAELQDQVQGPAFPDRGLEKSGTGDSGDRDRKGRRGRRRRTRGGGFPDSKYASVDDVTSVGEEASIEEAVAETGETAEVFLLPGESLAKYRPTDRVGVEPDAVPLPDADTEAYALASAFPEPGYLPPQYFPISEKADEDESVSADALEAAQEVREQLSAELAEQDGSAVVEIFDELQVVEAAKEQTDEPVVPVTDDDPTEEREPPRGDPGQRDSEIEEPPPDEPGEEEPPREEPPPEEPGTDAPISASVRDGGSRFQHRASRRMRRRRGGEQGQSQPQPPQPQRLIEPVVEVLAEAKAGRSTDKPPLPSISDLLREGQEIIVQIAKEPLGQKGARITSHIALPGRYVVYMPTLEHLGVSRKIASDEERQRLKRVLQAARLEMTGGFIVRTAGEGHTEEEISADMAYLYKLWMDMRQRADKKPAPMLLHHDLDIVERILRDQLNDMFKTIWCDNEEVYESVLRFMQRFQPSLVGRVKMYTRSTPIFDSFSVTQEIEKALRPKVWLKSGGYIVINQTEALVAIDVNTGKYIGKSNRLEDTITKTNTEAVKEIVRQIRLRDLGGIIVVDFIDMDERKNRQKVMQTLEEAMRADRAPYKILQFNDFGLVAITRKRVKQSLERSLCTPCPTCEGASYVKSVQTVIGEMLQEAMKVRPQVEGKNVMLRAFPEVARYLKSNSNTYLEELEEILGRPVLVTSDPLLHPEKFDFAW